MYDTPSYKQGVDRRNAVAIFVASCLLIVLLCIYGNAWYVANQYDHAPGCGGVDINPSLPPCTYETTRLTNEATQWRSSGKSTTKLFYVVDLDDGSSSGLSVTVVDPNFWEGVTKGDQVRVQMWQGKTAMLSAKGMETQTSHNPDYARSNAQRILLTGGGIAVLGIILSLAAPYLKLNQSSGNGWANLRGD